MKQIQTGKQSTYGQHVFRRTSVDPPALNNYDKLLMKRPSSERPLDSADEGRNDLKMLMTMNNPSTDVNNESVRQSDVSRHAIGSTPLQTNNFTHEAMLLSQYGKTSKNTQGAFFPKQRSGSQFRQTMNMNDILSNQSLLQTNMSTSTMIDSSRALKQKRSLNFINKKRDAERIDFENAQLMKRLEKLGVSPHIDQRNIKRQMDKVKTYKKAIQGTSNRHVNVNGILYKEQSRKAELNTRRHHGHLEGMPNARLPPLPENYFGSQIDEVSSARDSCIENESQIKQYREKKQQQEDLIRKLSMPRKAGGSPNYQAKQEAVRQVAFPN